MAGCSTTRWSASESSLARSSFNSIVGPRGRKFDVPDAMMRAAAMGRSAELGDEWEPPGIACRRIAEVLTKRSNSAPRLGPPPPRPQQRAPAPREVLAPLGRHAEGQTEWASMLPPRAQGLAVRATRALDAGPPAAAPRVVYPPSGQEGATATAIWSTKESSLTRDSFNAMASKQKFDSTEVLMRNTTMSKAAMMGPGWQPAGIVSRQIAEMLTNT